MRLNIEGANLFRGSIKTSLIVIIWYRFLEILIPIRLISMRFRNRHWYRVLLRLLSGLMWVIRMLVGIILSLSIRMRQISLIHVGSHCTYLWRLSNFEHWLVKLRGYHLRIHPLRGLTVLLWIKLTGMKLRILWQILLRRYVHVRT